MQKLTKTVFWISVSALFLIPLYALIFDTALLAPFVTSKTVYFRILVEVAFIGWTFLVAVDPKYRIKFSATTIIVTVFAIIALVADLFGVQPLKSLLSNLDRMEGWILIIHLWAFYIASVGVLGSFPESRKIWHRLFNVSLAVAAIVSIYGLFQIWGWATYHQLSFRIDASFGNADYLAIYLLFHAFIAACMFFIAREGKLKFSSVLKWLYPLLAIIFVFDIYETGDRGVLLGVLIGAMASLIAFAIWGRNKSQKSRMWAGGMVVIILVGGIVFWSVRNTSIVKTNPLLGRFAQISLTNASDQGRLFIWPMALKGATAHPLLGWGQENFNYVFDSNYNPSMYGQEPWFDRAHNGFLDWLIAGGILGLLVYVSLYVFLIINIWKSSLGFSEKCAFTGLVVGLIVNAMFTFDVLANYVGLFMALAFFETDKKGREAPAIEQMVQPISSQSSAPQSPSVPKYVALSVYAVVFLVFMVYEFNWRPIIVASYGNAALDTCSYQYPRLDLFEKAFNVDTYVANQDVRENFHSCTDIIISNPSVATTTKQAFYNISVNQIQKEINDAPNDPRSYTDAGSFFDQIGRFSQAEPFLVKARELMPGKETISIELVLNYLYQGKVSQALPILSQLYQTSPDYGPVKPAYGIALLISKDALLASKVLSDDPRTLALARSYIFSGNAVRAITLIQDFIPQSGDPNTLLQRARVLYASGDVSGSIAVLRQIEGMYPQFKVQVDAAINQAEGSTTPKY